MRTGLDTVASIRGCDVQQLTSVVVATVTFLCDLSVVREFNNFLSPSIGTIGYLEGVKNLRHKESSAVVLAGKGGGLGVQPSVYSTITGLDQHHHS